MMGVNDVLYIICILHVVLTTAADSFIVCALVIEQQLSYKADAYKLPTIAITISKSRLLHKVSSIKKRLLNF